MHKQKIFLLLAALLFLCLTALVLLTSRTARDLPLRHLAILTSEEPHAAREIERGLTDALESRGLTEGENLAIDRRTAANSKLSEPLARSIVAARPDVLLAEGEDAARAASRQTKSIPILATQGEKKEAAPVDAASPALLAQHFLAACGMDYYAQGYAAGLMAADLLTGTPLKNHLHLVSISVYNVEAEP